MANAASQSENLEQGRGAISHRPSVSPRACLIFVFYLFIYFSRPVGLRMTLGGFVGRELNRHLASEYCLLPPRDVCFRAAGSGRNLTTPMRSWVHANSWPVIRQLIILSDFVSLTVRCDPTVPYIIRLARTMEVTCLHSLEIQGRPTTSLCSPCRARGPTAIKCKMKQLSRQEMWGAIRQQLFTYATD